MLHIDYYVATILAIDMIPLEDGEDHPLTHEEFIEEIRFAQISKEQYKRLNYVIDNTKSKIEVLRKEALSVPVFTSSDFHAMDNFLRELGGFISYYSWVKDDLNDFDNDKRLKEKLICFLDTAETNPFHGGFLDNLWKWYRIKKFSLKRLVGKKKKDETSLLKDSEIPF
jgi:hypothetical protein